MLVPVVKWYDENNATEKEGHDFGKIDIGSASDEVTILVWNNRGGEEEASMMENCVLTTKDLDGGNDLEAVSEQYVHVLNESAGEVEFTPVGGDVEHPIKAGGDAEDGEILGVINDGSVANAAGNHVKLKLKVDLPSTATNGKNSLWLRLRYTYV